MAQLRPVGPALAVRPLDAPASPGYRSCRGVVEAARMAGGLRVLMLDDSPLSLAIVGEALTAAGFQVTGASTLDDFQDALDREPPDLILTDVQMPDVSGDNVCRLLKHLHETKSIPIVLFSTLPAAELAELAARAGADAFVCKREGPTGIVRRISALVEEMLF